MNGIRERKFHFAGRDLTVRAAAFPEGWRIRVFEGDRPVTEIAYEVKHELTIDAAMISLDLVDQLMEGAEMDILRKWVPLVP